MGRLNAEAEDQNNVSKHRHPLVLTRIHNSSEVACSCCRINILPGEDCCACMPCRFFLHKRCFELPPYARVDPHPHRLTLTLESPYEGEEGFSCDLCAQPGTFSQWLYCCKDCHHDVHLHCARSQTGPNLEASWRPRSLASVKPAPLVNASTSDTQSANPPSGVTDQPVLLSPNAMTMTPNQVPLHTTTPPTIMSQHLPNTSQFAPNCAYVHQSGNISNGFQTSNYPFSPTNASNPIQPIPTSPHGTNLFTTPGPIHSITNHALGVPQSRPSTAYSNNGVVYLTGAQGINNQPIYLRPNVGGAPMAAMVPQNQGLGYGHPGSNGANHGMMGGIKEMAIGGVASGIGESFGGEIFQGARDMWGGGGGGGGGGDGDGGSMSLDGTEIMNSYVGEYF